MGCFWPGIRLRVQERTIAQALRQAGYATGHFGKWHLNGVAGQDESKRGSYFYFYARECRVNNSTHTRSCLMRITMSIVASLVACLTLLVATTHAADAAAKGPCKVFILAGQSNMEGAGAIRGNLKRNDGKGGLEYLVKDPKTADRFKHLVEQDGEWRVRDDVFISYFDRRGGLSAGYGSSSSSIGPELQFGHVVGDHFDEPVLLIKTAWGGKSLAGDFRPPSSEGETGPFYTKMIDEIKSVLANLKEDWEKGSGLFSPQPSVPTPFPGYEIAGFGWHQGWNDGCSRKAVDEYEENMANFIRDVRKDLGVKDLPFVIANSGFGGWNQKNDRRLGIMKAQAAAANHPDFEGTATCVETRDFWRPADVSPAGHGFHWNSNAESYFLIGDSMGRAMIKLIESR